MAKKKLKLTPVQDLGELGQRAKNEPAYAELAAMAVQNLGIEHLRNGKPGLSGDLEALDTFWGVMAGEYGQPEDEALQGIMSEVNGLIPLLQEAMR